MIVTLFLISVNVYYTIEAPPHRGMSKIEIWILGNQLPFIISLVEYGIVLVKMRKIKICTKPAGIMSGDNSDLVLQTYDKRTLLFTSLYLIIFQVTYWAIELSSY